MLGAEGEGVSYDVLTGLVVAQAWELEQLRLRVEQLAADNAELRARLGRNSQNSSTPPSADRLAKPPPRSMRTRGERRAGKQPRAPGAGLAQVAIPGPYGPNVVAIAAYLSAQHHVPTGRLVEILFDLVDVQVSAGWAVDVCRRVGDAVAAANEAVKDVIAAAPVAYFDESVTWVAGRNRWLHIAATATLTAYHIDEHGRSAKSITAFGILPRFTGLAVHDAYSAYNSFACTHALCNAHVLREATGIASRPRRRLGRRPGQPAQRAHRWAEHWRWQGHQRLPAFKLDDLYWRYDRLIDRALKLHPQHTGNSWTLAASTQT